MRQKFTGYERDNETGLDFAQARYYSNVQGRFTSPDPLLESAKRTQPQSWNRYTYTLNNPLLYVDPTGTIWVRNNQNGEIGWIADDQWEEAQKQTYGDGQQQYTAWTQMEYDSVNGQRVKLLESGPTADNPSGFIFVGPNQGSGASEAMGGGALLIRNAPGWLKLSSVFAAAYALYLHASHETLQLPVILSEAKEEPETPNPDDSRNLTDKVGRIARDLGLTERQVRDAIHKAKEELPRSGPVRNPDVLVDTTTGEIYPKTPNGGKGDTLGNVRDFLP